MIAGEAQFRSFDALMLSGRLSPLEVIQISRPTELSAPMRTVNSLV